MGMGKYQKAIWLLCGFGYFVDLMWAQVSAAEPFLSISHSVLIKLLSRAFATI